jgi:hypothetical protein
MKVKQKVQLDNRRMQMANMMRQSLAGWNAEYHIADDFANADHGNKWKEISETFYAVGTFVLVVVAIGVWMGVK